MKNDIFNKLEAQRNHRDHVLRYNHSPYEAQKEVEDWMWKEMKERAIRFFEIYDYKACQFEDVLFIGALHDVFEKRLTRNRAEQKDLLMILEDSCKVRRFPE